MTPRNTEIAAIFEEIADLLEIEGENPFRIRAYRNAARELESLAGPVAEMVARDEDLTRLPGIGEDLAGKIREIVATGKCAALEKLRKQLPPTISPLLRVPGLGPKRVKALYEQLNVRSLAQLRQAARKGAIRGLRGFGEKTEHAILDALEKHAEEPRRFELAVATQYAEPLVGYLGKARNVAQVVVAGSYRRARETVGDLDILVSTRGASDVMERLVRYDRVRDVVARGTTRATVILDCGLQVDLRVVPQASFGAALHYFTGSKAHNIAIRRLGQQKGLKINEYGVFRGDKRIAGATEEEVFAAVGLPWIRPELRENHGEIEAARAAAQGTRKR
jgi:DNA polymerase (family X)